LLIAKTSAARLDRCRHRPLVRIDAVDPEESVNRSFVDLAAFFGMSWAADLNVVLFGAALWMTWY
jgi:hypothetical protein